MPSRSFRLLRIAAVTPLAIFAAASCSDEPVTSSTNEPPTLLEPGEICDADNRPDLKITFDPPTVVVAAGQVRPVRIVIEPDACDPSKATFESANAGIAEAPSTASFDLRHATYDFQVKGGTVGRTTITASMNTRDVNGKEFVLKAELPIDVRDGAAPTCSAGDVSEGQLATGSTELHGKGSLDKAVVSAAEKAFVRTDELGLPSFPASVTCNEGDLTSVDPKLVKLGPAVTFTARAPLSNTKPLRREVDFAIPVNPATMPSAARLRHLVVLYSGPKAKTPRPVTIANPRIEAAGDGYVLKFSSQWFGTYQAAVANDAGTKMRKRKLTHRAVIGISMGGGGAATFGIRHHDKVDVIGALGGPVDYTWLLHFIEEFALGGFCPVGKTCPTVAPNMYPVDSPYAHTMDYDHWFFEKGEGNGGSWGRDNYIQAFEDLAIANANPNGWNADPNLLHLAMGPKVTDPWVKGPDGLDCSIPIEPIGDDPNEEKQREREAACKAWRCKPENVWKAETGYYDDEYNPDGSQQVISFCDGKDTGEGSYSLSYGGPGDKPMNLALAVDLNKNGVRDPGEPIIRSGHEPFDDCGTDGLCNEQEPGYDAELNPDPNQDDYDYAINPTGTEGNHVYDLGEPFRDFGLDGVPDTKDKHVAGDPGEGDGKFTQSPGFDAFLKNDPHQIIAGHSIPPAGPMTDDALRRIDILTDGGVRDLFNFGVLASHLTGAISARKVRSTAFYNGFDMLPGETPGDPNNFTAHTLRWADIADFPSVRYGSVDATEAQLKLGDGKHVGTGPQILSRLQNAFFYVAKAWPDADRRVSIDTREKPAASTINELGIDCEIIGKCATVFTGPKTKRTGPISVTLPPGYAHEDNVKRGVRYPVLYVLHGYGQTPSELEALAIFSNNFMNLANRSYATRLGKFITVYVDGRCREKDGRPECIRGTFYLDSARPGGAVVDSWFEELLDYVDKNYRTLGETEVEVPE